jgi:transcriptional/translational regulatory protein YebC/TACO1
MNNNNINKNDLINSISYYYLQKGLLCKNINKLPKKKLLEIYNENNIEFISNERLKEITLETEQFNYLKDIIYCNYIKYENVPKEVIMTINSNTTLDELNEIIKKFDLKYEDNFNNLKELTLNLYKIYNNYCNKSNINVKNNIDCISLPVLLKSFKEIINSP